MWCLGCLGTTSALVLTPLATRTLCCYILENDLIVMPMKPTRTYTCNLFNAKDTFGDGDVVIVMGLEMEVWLSLWVWRSVSVSDY